MGQLLMQITYSNLQDSLGQGNIKKHTWHFLVSGVRMPFGFVATTRLNLHLHQHKRLPRQLHRCGLLALSRIH